MRYIDTRNHDDDPMLEVSITSTHANVRDMPADTYRHIHVITHKAGTRPKRPSAACRGIIRVKTYGPYAEKGMYPYIKALVMIKSEHGFIDNDKF